MTDCCKSQEASQEGVPCPDCGAFGKDVKVRTLKHWLKAPFVAAVPETSFYFCGTKACPVVYFAGDQSERYGKEQLRFRVGIKETSGSIPACYCFGVTREMIAGNIRETGKSDFSNWIAGEVKAGNCACDIRNPSGRCCLGEVKRMEAPQEPFLEQSDRIRASLLRDRNHE